jgi:SAM-dependent methyltransferase
MSGVLQRSWRRLKAVLPPVVSERATVIVQACLNSLRGSSDSPARRARLDRLVQQHADRVARAPHLDIDDESFREYAATQIGKSMAATRLRVVGPLLAARTERLVGLMHQVLPADRTALSILCIGCRNAVELDHVGRTCGVRDVRGLDLFSEDPRIEAGDMHALPFADECFDAVYACHSLEHAHDLDGALAEAVRVTRPGGLLVIEMPIGFPISPTDRWDVESSAGLLARLPSVRDVVLREDTGDAVRVIVRVSDRTSAV